MKPIHKTTIGRTATWICVSVRDTKSNIHFRGHFEVERVGTPFQLLKSLRTYYGLHCETFSGPKCILLQDFAYKNSNFYSGCTPYLRSKHQFPLRSPAFPLVLFYETTTYTLTYSFQYVTHVSLKHNTSLTDDDLI